MAEIALSRGIVAQVDDADFSWLNQWKWHSQVYRRSHSTSIYACRNVLRPNGQYGTMGMHRQILGLDFGDPRFADHINHDTLDNRRTNLRIATREENMRNRKTNKNNTTGFKGVSFHPKVGRYRAGIRLKGKLVYLGWADTPEAAHAIYCAAAKEHFGEFANFGDRK